MTAAAETRGLARGQDGRLRCRWALSAPEYLAYHDDEWGRPITDDDALYERLCLESFQSGLSWLTILRKREAFRRAFEGFRIERVVRFGPRDVERLLGDASIVRNRQKIEAAIANARAAAAAIEELGSLAALLLPYRPRRQRAPRSLAEIPSQTAESVALARELRRRGFRFLGPTTLYATMQACGLVNDHLVGCIARRRA